MAVRRNNDIEYIVLHHTEQSGFRSVIDLNNQYVQRNQFGLPYDVLIRQDGQVSIGPRWLYASTGNQILVDVPVHYLRRYSQHHPAGITFFNNAHLTGVHIALEGDFNLVPPKPIQLSVLQDVIDELQTFLLNLISIKYHNEIEVTSCPGFLFDYKPILKITEHRQLIAAGFGPPSQSDIDQLIAPPSAFVPPFFRIIHITSTTMTLEWGSLDPVWDVDHFTIYRRGSLATDTNLIQDYRKAGDIPAGTFTFLDTLLLPGFFYEYLLIVTLKNGRQSEQLGPVSDYTHPQGAWDASLSKIDTGTSYWDPTYDWKSTPKYVEPPVPPFYGNCIDHSHITIEGWLYAKKDGIFWARESVEHFGVGTIGGYMSVRLDTNHHWRINAWKLQAAPDYSPFPDLDIGVVCPMNEWHHWAFSYSLGNANGQANYISVYKDGALIDPQGEGFTYGGLGKFLQGTHWIFVPCSGRLLYANSSQFFLMTGKMGILDEFRYWSYERSLSEIQANYLYTLRIHPALIVRYGFDNYSHTDTPFPPEFESYGDTGLDPFTSDRGYSINIQRRIVEPSPVQEPPQVILTAPILLTPTNGTGTVVVNPRFTWTGVIGATTYQLQLATDSNFTSLLVNQSGISGTSLQLGSILELLTQYYWRVRAFDFFGNAGPYSNTFTFITESYLAIQQTIQNPTLIIYQDPYDVNVSEAIQNPTLNVYQDPYDTVVTESIQNPELVFNELLVMVSDSVTVTESITMTRV